MKAARIVSPFILSAVLAAQSTAPVSTPGPGDVMIVGVAHDSSVMGGGIGSSNYLPEGKVAVQPIAWLTPGGEWKKLPCDDVGPSGYSSACKKLDRDYLSKPHDYSVVSADGLGATVHVSRMNLDHECFGIYGDGTFTGADIRYATVAAESGGIFTTGLPLTACPKQKLTQFAGLSLPLPAKSSTQRRNSASIRLRLRANRFSSSSVYFSNTQTSRNIALPDPRIWTSFSLLAEWKMAGFISCFGRNMEMKTNKSWDSST
jgi:hypothetical protein